MSLRYKITRRLAQVVRRRGGPGYVDHFDAHRIAGWAADPADPGSPALLSLTIDGMPAMNIAADLARDDVQAAGMGPRICGFDATLPRRLRDGKAHVVELRLGPDGPLVRGGRLRIPADPDRDPAAGEAAETLDNPSGAPEGVAFYNPRTAAIEGWATGCASVWVQFPGQGGQTVVLDRDVPGFGSGSRQGFAVKLPRELMDGRRHVLEVCFEAGGEPLDGAPVTFATGIDSPRVTIVRRNGPRLQFEIRDIEGHLVPQDIRVHGDTLPLQVRPVEDRVGLYDVTLPEGLTHLTVSDLRDAVLARYVVRGTGFEEAPVAAAADGGPDSELCARAREAFEAFCAAPDERFDPLWYRWAVPGAHGLAEEALIAHYRDHAGAGVSPGPGFDEVAARRMTPALVPAIEAGSLPCAFAMELVQGRGGLNSLAHLPPPQARAIAHGAAGLRGAQAAPNPEPVAERRRALPVTMPAPTSLLPASDSIYAAWVSRLLLSNRERHQFEDDERALRRDIAKAPLTRAPLVTIIMPSWNRAFTIGEAIQSVLDQTYGNWELIVCDDASEDRTVDVVRRFDDDRIRYMKFLKSNGAGARNKGLRHARGEYIAYLDSDNIWHPQFLDMMIRQLLNRPGFAIAYSAYLDTEIDGAKVLLQGVARNHFRPVQLSSKNVMDLNTIVHHRRAYDWLGGFDNSLPRLQDWDLMLRYTGVFRPLFVNRIGVFYRRNAAWGQVTHLHMGSGAQNTVNAKSRARLEGGHERLAIDWPARGRIAILCSQHRARSETERSRSLAESLARMASDVADVDLVMFEEEDAPGAAGQTAGAPPADSLQSRETNLPDGVARHVIPHALARDPLQLGLAMAPQLQGRPVLSVGLRNETLRAIVGLDPDQTYRLRPSGDGCVLQGLGEPMIQFDLGALPLALPEGAHDPEDLTVLVLPPANAKRGYREELAAEGRRRDLRLVLPPQNGSDWQLVQNGTVSEIEADGAMPDILGRCAMTVALGQVSDLSMFDMALLNALQGRGVPAAVLPDGGRAKAWGIANQWIEARAAYEIKTNTLKWIFDKVRKLLADPGGMEQLSERSRTVHRIAHAPDLVQERMAHALYRMLCEPPKREVLDANN